MLIDSPSFHSYTINISKWSSSLSKSDLSSSDKSNEYFSSHSRAASHVLEKSYTVTASLRLIDPYTMLYVVLMMLNCVEQPASTVNASR